MECSLQHVSGKLHSYQYRNHEQKDEFTKANEANKTRRKAATIRQKQT